MIVNIIEIIFITPLFGLAAWIFIFLLWGSVFDKKLRDQYLSWPGRKRPAGPFGKAYMIFMTMCLIVLFGWLAMLPIVRLFNA